MFAKYRNAVGITSATLLLAFIASGCGGGYYMIKDPTSGREYYTTEYKEKKGVTTFEDEKTGSAIKLQNTEISKLTKDQYRAAVPKK